jgi:hypothetical protein
MLVTQRSFIGYLQKYPKEVWGYLYDWIT